MQITVEARIQAPVSKVWAAYTTPDDIVQWNAASDDWHTTKASVDLREGGAFSSRMEAKDGSFGFDFAGTYTKVVPHQRIEYAFGNPQFRDRPDRKGHIAYEVSRLEEWAKAFENWTEESIGNLHQIARKSRRLV